MPQCLGLETGDNANLQECGSTATDVSLRFDPKCLAPVPLRSRTHQAVIAH